MRTASSPPVLSALRAATAERHRRLEGRMPLAASDLTRAEYLAVLRADYGFYEPLERRLDPWARGVPNLAWPQRRKTAALERDLRALGQDSPTIAALPRCDALPAVTGPEAALGCLYVLEGATLGGRILRRRVRDRLGIDETSGGAFLDVYGERTGARWRGFLACLDTVTTTAGQRDTVAAATATFAAFEDWLDACGALR